MMTSQFLLTHHQIIHLASPTLKGQALSQVWKCYYNHDQSHTFELYTTLKQVAFMLLAVLVGKPQNHVVLVAKTTLTTIKTKHIKTYPVLATAKTLLYCKVATQYSQGNFESPNS